jgi:predicted permease
MADLLLGYLKILGWVGLPIALGVVARRFAPARRLSKTLFDVSFYGCYTPIMVLSVWIARLSDSAVWLPLLALCGWLISAGFAWVLSQPLEHGPRERGAFISVMCQSNIGFTLLGLVALTLFGETGLAQAAYTQLFYVPFYLLFCFPIARAYGRREQGGLGRLLLDNLVDPRVWVPLSAMSLGLALNLSGIERPEWCRTVTGPAIYLGAALAGVAIGLLYSGLFLERYRREHLISFGYRSTLYPLLFFGMAALFGLGGLDTRVLVLYGLVPSGLLANVLAMYFELDTELTSSVFMVGTGAFLVAVLPAYAYFAMP